MKSTTQTTIKLWLQIVYALLGIAFIVMEGGAAIYGWVQLLRGAWPAATTYFIMALYFNRLAKDINKRTK